MGAIDLLRHLQGAGLSIKAAGDKLTVTPADRLTDDLRQTIRTHKAELLEALTTPTTRHREQEPNECEPWEGQEPDPQDLAHLRLMAMGLDSNTADALAAWMMLRSESGDERITCYECRHFRPKGKLCGNHVQADMPRELGTDLATKPQRCPGFTTSQPFIQNGANPAMVRHSG